MFNKISTEFIREYYYLVSGVSLSSFFPNGHLKNEFNFFLSLKVNIFPTLKYLWHTIEEI